MNITILGAGNIGTELAVRLAKNNAVLLIDRFKPAHLDDVTAGNPRIRFVQGDALNTEQMRALLTPVVDILVSTVGTFSDVPAVNSMDGFTRDFELNFFGNLIPIKTVLPEMRRQKRGQILIVTSNSAHLSPNNLTAYAPSKWALERLCGALRNEVEPQGIRIATVSPATLKNKYSTAFPFKSGYEPDRVAAVLERLIVGQKSANRFVPAWYRPIHAMERLFPYVLNRKYGLKSVRSRQAVYRSQPIESVLITGATSGLGHALAERYATSAKRLHLIARRGEKLAAIKKDLQTKHSCEIMTHIVDIGDPPALAAFLTTFQGSVDLIINNAGIHVHGEVLETSLALYHQTLNTNFLGAVRIIASFMNRTVKPRKIINILSTTAIAGRRYHSAYAASKAALWSFSRSLRRLHGNDLQVLEAMPATFESDLFKSGIRAGKDSSERAQPLSARLLKSAEVARRIQDAERQGRDAVLIPFEARLFLSFEALVPSVFRQVFK